MQSFVRGAAMVIVCKVERWEFGAAPLECQAQFAGRRAKCVLQRAKADAKWIWAPALCPIQQAWPVPNSSGCDNLPRVEYVHHSAIVSSPSWSASVRIFSVRGSALKKP